MNENGEILKSLGELTGLVKASSSAITTLSSKHDKLVEATQEIAVAVQVMQTGYNAKEVSCAKEFKDINDKLGRDYETINELKTKSIVNDGVDKYKDKKRDWWQWALGIVGAFIGILIGINQLIGIGQKIGYTKVRGTPAVYAAPLNAGKVDSTKDSPQTFRVDTDTIRGN
jgi:hypothetical protein